MVLPELHDVLVSVGQLEQWRALDTSLAAELSSRRQRGDAFFAPPAQWPSQAEKDVYKRVEALAQDLGAVDVRRSDYLLDCFESDVTFKVPTNSGSRSGHTGASSSMVTINIEVDGQHHKNSRKKTFCRRRDKVLHAAGVRVIRLDVTKESHLLRDQVGLDKWIREEVAAAMATSAT
jgi:hypothetical protein